MSSSSSSSPSSPIQDFLAKEAARISCSNASCPYELGYVCDFSLRCADDSKAVTLVLHYRLQSRSVPVEYNYIDESFTIVTPDGKFQGQGYKTNYMVQKLVRRLLSLDATPAEFAAQTFQFPTKENPRPESMLALVRKETPLFILHDKHYPTGVEVITKVIGMYEANILSNRKHYGAADLDESEKPKGSKKHKREEAKNETQDEE